MRKLILTMVVLLITCSVYAQERPTGRDKLCNDIAYFSVGGNADCMEAKMIPMSFYDKEVAMAEALTEKTIDNSQIINKTYIINKAPEIKDSNDVNIKSTMEYTDSDNDFPNGGFATGYNSETYHKK